MQAGLSSASKEQPSVISSTEPNPKHTNSSKATETGTMARPALGVTKGHPQKGLLDPQKSHPLRSSTHGSLRRESAWFRASPSSFTALPLGAGKEQTRQFSRLTHILDRAIYKRSHRNVLPAHPAQKPSKLKNDTQKISLGFAYSAKTKLHNSGTPTADKTFVHLQPRACTEQGQRLGRSGGADAADGGMARREKPPSSICDSKMPLNRVQPTAMYGKNSKRQEMIHRYNKNGNSFYDATKVQVFTGG